VDPERIEAVVVFAEGEATRTAEVEGAAHRALTLLPGLRGHRCDNAAGKRFSDEVSDTELAHLLEHVALELMVLAGSPDTLRGDTAWDRSADGPGVFRVRVAYDDDLVCLGAIRLAERIVTWSLSGSDSAPDVVSGSRRLKELRSR